MHIVFCILGFVSLAIYYAIPLLNYYSQKEAREAQERYYLFKLRVVRDYYESVHHLSYREIAERYDISKAYDNIGQVSGRMP